MLIINPFLNHIILDGSNRSPKPIEESLACKEATVYEKYISDEWTSPESKVADIKVKLTLT